MGFTGDYIVARRRTSLLELPLIGAVEPVCGPDDMPGTVRICERRPGDWQTVEVEYGLPAGRDWLSALVAGTRGPVMIASVFEDRFGAVAGLEPGGAAPWSVRLHPESRQVLPGPSDPFPEQPPEWIVSGPHLTGTAAVEALAGWSAAAGTEADPVRLATALAGTREYYVETVFSRLLAAAGLGEPLDEDHVDDDGHSVPSGWRDPAKVELSITAMKPGIRRTLHCTEHEDCFAKVWLRPDGVYELEYGSQSPGERYRAVAPSLEQVGAAMVAWSAGETEWRDAFAWSRISSSDGS